MQRFKKWFVWRMIHARPRLFGALLLAGVTALVLPTDWVSRGSTRFLLAWNAGALTYLLLAMQMCLAANTSTMHRRARLQSESRLMILALVILAAVASLAAIVAELATVKNLQGTLKIAHLLLAGLTIASSWAFTHTMFALHYAHDYYDAVAKNQAGGLDFTGTQEPEYGDFVYCAFIIGTSGQTADVSFTSKAMRRTGLVHSVLAFVFNTAVLATTINIAASFI